MESIYSCRSSKSLDPNFTIEQYHVVVVSLNGSKSILKIQDQTVGINLPEVLSTDFIALPTSTGIKEMMAWE
jgi:hypothetical protein